MYRNKIPLSFYRQDDVVQIARELVGMKLCTKINGETTAAIITETEAYCGRSDKACHASGGTRTSRTETMYQAGGVAYVYLCYGIHHLFNIVTNVEGKADAVLIRAVKPIEGIEVILERRETDKISPLLTAGPGRLTQALGITTSMDGTSLIKNSIWIEKSPHDEDIPLIATTRVGVDYAGEDAHLPWRFYAKESKWVSQK